MTTPTHEEGTATVSVENLFCEYAENPLGIDVRVPRFSWRLVSDGRGRMQTAYRILVASSENLLDAGQADVWDSGRVESDVSMQIEYGGPPLESRRRLFWTVTVWDNEGRPSGRGPTAWFEMGLLHLSDWEVDWIGLDGTKYGEGLLYRSEFSLSRPVRAARVYIACIGYYELRMNGRKIGDHLLDPGWTDIQKSVLYVTYDVTENLREGRNAVGVVLGNGWQGFPRLRVQIEVEYADGDREIVSKRDWRWFVASGPILKNSLYDGELYDARRERPGWDLPDYRIDRLEWVPGRHQQAPAGVLRAQMLEPIRAVDTIRPVRMTNPRPGVFVFDMGQNFAGWSRLKVSGPRGTTVVLRHGEILYPDGTVDQENLRTARQTSTYILKGEGVEVYEPRFTYYGFRYVEMEGFPGAPAEDAVIGIAVRSSVARTGTFRCSNELINTVHRNVVWTEASNLHSVPTDCPQRDERMGWLNDMTARAEEAICNFDMVRLYTKWLQDIRDAQDEDSGAVPDTAPYRWGEWEGDPVDCFVFLAYSLYLYYGDVRILQVHYEALKKWVRFIGSRSDGHIVGYTAFGDWCTPVADCFPADAADIGPDNKGAHLLSGAYSAVTPGSLVSTAFYYYNAVVMTRIAEILDRRDDAEGFSRLSERIRDAFNARFFDEKSGQYASGSQGSNTLPLFLDMVPEGYRDAVLENLVRDITEYHDGHLNTGNQCTKLMFEVLTRLGKGDIVYGMATKTTYPSWGYMIERGATTIWERWEVMRGSGMNSYSHPMLGSIDAWYYKYLAGIRISPDGPGWKRIIFEPHPVGGLAFAEASLQTLRGTVGCSWRKSDNLFEMHVQIPVNSSAEVTVPLDGAAVSVSIDGTDILSDGRVLSHTGAARDIRREDDCLSMTLGSGVYRITARKET